MECGAHLISIDGAQIIIGNIYLHQEEKKKEKLDLYLSMIEEIATPFDKIPILLYGDFNLNAQTVWKSLENSKLLWHKYGLRIHEDYKSPFDSNKAQESKATRMGMNNQNQIAYSRIDFIITNIPLTSEWSHNILFSDHAVTLIRIDRKTLGCIRKIKEIPMRKTLTKLIVNQITTEPTQKKFCQLLQYLEKNNEIYLKKENNVKQSLNEELDIQNIDPSSLAKQWLEDFNTFSENIIKMRFSPQQNRAFKLIKAVTKYHQMAKKDGSIITFVKLGNNIITDSLSVADLLISHIKQNDLEMINRLGNYEVDKPSKLQDLGDIEIRNLITRMAKNKAIPIYSSLIMPYMK